jgi:hypothetical protein
VQIGGESSPRFREESKFAGLESNWPLDLREVMEAATAKGSDVEPNAFGMDIGALSPQLNAITLKPVMVEENQKNFGSNIPGTNAKESLAKETIKTHRAWSGPHHRQSTRTMRGTGLSLLSLGGFPISSWTLILNHQPDAGGSRGISQLKILTDLMHRLNYEAQSNDMDRPCAVFDMICGVSSGGYVGECQSGPSNL